VGRIEFTTADRGPDGRLLVEPPMERIRRIQAELEGSPEQSATPAEPAPEQPAEIKPQLPIATYRQLGAALVFIAVALLVAWIAFRPGPPTTDDRPPATAGPAGVAAQPPSAAPAATEQPAQVEAYAAPGGAQLGPIDANAKIQYRHSEYPEWGGVEWNDAIVWIEADHAPPTSLPDLARPTPAPTPVYIKVEVPVEPPCDVAVNPRYVAQIDVALDGRPLGQVIGRSCDSQADAQTDAETQAAQMRAAAPPPCPTWAGPPFVKPDCVK
jgi:hypothetical protein